MIKNNKIVVFHQHKQHSFELATALKKNNKLFKYITVVYDSKYSYTSKLKKFLKGNQLKKANGRKCPNLNDEDVLTYSEILGLIYLAIIRIPKSINILRKWDRYINKSFGKKVAKYVIDNNSSVIIGYDRYSYNCFKMLKEKNDKIISILDVSIVTTPYMKQIFENDMEKSNMSDLKDGNLFLWDNEVMNNYIEEIKNTDFFLAPSKVVKDSLLFCGVKEEQVKIVPYGVDINKFSYVKKKVHNNPLKLIFVGQVNSRKGIHHLLNVIRRFTPEEVCLEIIGSYDSRSEIYMKNSSLENVKFVGFVTRDILAKKYQEADVFVLPSLGEGMALVGLESLSTGTPIICSDKSGVNDIIVNGSNGYVFDAGDNDSLEKIIRLLINNREKLPYMSENARKTAEKYTWENYRKNVVQAIDSIILESSVKKDKLKV